MAQCAEIPLARDHSPDCMCGECWNAFQKSQIEDELRRMDDQFVDIYRQIVPSLPLDSTMVEARLEMLLRAVASLRVDFMTLKSRFEAMC